jgi:hypothetical protein
MNIARIVQNNGCRRIPEKKFLLLGTETLPSRAKNRLKMFIRRTVLKISVSCVEGTEGLTVSMSMKESPEN